MREGRADWREKEVRAKIDQIYKKKGLNKPSYQGNLPAGNNGLGLMLLGITGDQVLPADVYKKKHSDTSLNLNTN